VGFVALQAALGWSCPLSELENTLAGRPAGTPFLPADAGIPVWGLALTVAAYLFVSGVGHVGAWRLERSSA
jgi:hypothetical protein